jgi:hypothetical protein
MPEAKEMDLSPTGLGLGDEFVRVDVNSLSIRDVGNAGIKNLREIAYCSVNDSDPSITTHAVHFRRGGRLVVTYSNDGGPLDCQASGVQFERLGQEVFASELTD